MRRCMSLFSGVGAGLGERGTVGDRSAVVPVMDARLPMASIDADSDMSQQVTHTILRSQQTQCHTQCQSVVHIRLQCSAITRWEFKMAEVGQSDLLQTNVTTTRAPPCRNVHHVRCICRKRGCACSLRTSRSNLGGWLRVRCVVASGLDLAMLLHAFQGPLGGCRPAMSEYNLDPAQSLCALSVCARHLCTTSASAQNAANPAHASAQLVARCDQRAEERFAQAGR
jgi:hypothetical protein